jgi:anthranilate synthase component 2
VILLIDNYDSFSYNLYQLIGGILQGQNGDGSFCPDGASRHGQNGDGSFCLVAGPDMLRVIRNDELTAAEIATLAPSHIVLSPGPGKPADAGVCVDVVKKCAGWIPIFGVCLGHQAICEAFGATVTYAKELMHGKQSSISLDTDASMFRGLPSVIKGARYHSLAAVSETIPEALRVTATSADGEVMAVQHREFPVYGVQFHPESIMTPDGEAILRNFLSEDA